mmetsp:Transcript_9558/g.33302  ORF Transcript_9558/g.33302 Transcript_9558/m.33302 type:complete len:231 (+) Transcript_9558:491-1183(+)
MLATDLDTHEMKPSLESWPDMPTSTANHSNVSHAPFSCRQSCHFTTPVMSSVASAIMPVVTGETPTLSPNIHRLTASSMVPSMMYSFCDSGPMASRRFCASAGASGVCCTVGGMSLKTSHGVMSSAARVGTMDALSQVRNGEGRGKPVTSAQILSVRRFCAAPVIHMAEECAHACSCVWMRYAPILSAVGPGSLPAFFASDLMMGRNTPPALAVVEGIAGEMTASDIARP